VDAVAERRKVSETERQSGLRRGAESVLRFCRGNRAEAIKMLRRWADEAQDQRWSAVADLIERETPPVSDPRD